MPKKQKNAWTAPSLQDFNVASRKRFKPENDVVDSNVPEPKSVSELAVNPRKVAEVRKWLISCQSERSSILLICGPAGSGKTVTLRLLAESEGFNIIEWISPISKNNGPNFLDDFVDKSGFIDISEGKKFEEFINRSSRYPSLFQPKKRNLIMVKDIPNTFIWKPDLFHSFVEKYSTYGKSPIVFIVTDDENLDLQTTLFPNEIKGKLGIAVIKFNPVSDTFLKKNLKMLSEKIKGGTIPSECLDKIAKNAVGDLRSATMEVLIQLRMGELCSQGSQTTKRRKRNSLNEEEAVTSDVNPLSSRDHGYDFYKKMGRVLYPKRAGEESRSAKTSDFLHNVLEIADNWSKSNLSFLHENYLQTCSKIEDAAAAADCFSFCDTLSCHQELEPFTSIITVTGLMAANTQPKKSGFLPFKKSVNLNSLKERKCIFNEACVARFGVEERIFALDVAPMKVWLFLDVDPSIRTLSSEGRRVGAGRQPVHYPSDKNNRKGDEKTKNHDSSNSEASSDDFEIEDDDD